MFKLMGKELNVILGAQTILIWTYAVNRIKLVEECSYKLLSMAGGKTRDHCCFNLMPVLAYLKSGFIVGSNLMTESTSLPSAS